MMRLKKSLTLRLYAIVDVVCNKQQLQSIKLVVCADNNNVNNNNIINSACYIIISILERDKQ